MEASPGAEPLSRADLQEKTLAELHELASARGVPRYRLLHRDDLIDAVAGAENEAALAAGAPLTEPEALGEEIELETERAEEVEEEEPAEEEEEPEEATGVLDLMPERYGFVRVEGLGRSREDPYLSQAQVRRLGLRKGDELSGLVRRPRGSERYPSMIEVRSVNRVPPAELEDRPRFNELTPIWPDKRLPLGYGANALGLRMVELLAPIGHGQRCLVAGAPGAGATTLLQDLARAVVAGGDVVPVIVLLDPRPEELTDWSRSFDVPVQASEGDPDGEVKLSELALARAKRLVEQGSEVALVLDSASRLARAYSLSGPRSGAQARHSGGHAFAAHAVKQWFAAGRNIEGGGSLTVLATARVDSESMLDALTYDSLTDIANVELRLDRGLARSGLLPSLDPQRCRSSHEESIVGAEELARLVALRRSLAPLDSASAWELLAERIRAAGSNAEILAASEPQT